MSWLKALGGASLRLAAALAGINIVLIIVLNARSQLWSSQAVAVHRAVQEFVDALTQYRQREGHLPADANRDGEIDAAESALVTTHLSRAALIRTGAADVAVALKGRQVTLRAVSSRASAVAGFAWNVRNVVELRGLPCNVAEELDARNDDGNFATGNIRASVAACGVGGLNDPVPVVAVALRP